MQRHLFLAALAVGMGISAFGGDFYLKSGATDWSVASSYCTDESRTATATVLPGPSDAIHVLAEKFTFDCGTAAGLASLAAASNAYEIITVSGSELEISVPDNVSVGIGCRIRTGMTNADRIKATLTKKGEGTLSLLATENDDYLYAVNLDVKGGVLKLLQGTTINQWFGWLKLADGATVWLPCSPASGSQAYFHYIMAEEGSMITNATTRTSGHVFRATTATGSYSVESYIKGVIGGGARIWTSGNIRLDNTNNTMNNSVTVTANYGRFYQNTAGNCMGVVLAKTLGLAGEPSSLGVGDAVILSHGEGSGGIRYIGTGETTDKRLQFYQKVYGNEAKTVTAYPTFFDAGPCGGVTFTGPIEPFRDSGNDYGVRRLWLIGDNSNECVVAGSMNRLVENNTIYYPVFITKAGTGTWRFADSESRYHIGGTAILDGTLKFDSIDERGLWTSLGDASILTIDDSRAFINSNYVDYAFTLGGASGPADPVFEYSGAAKATCTTRPLVLAGTGGHLRASNGKLTFAGVSARDANATPTLTLDGTGTNELRNVSDGAAGAKVSVTKAGTGIWTLAGDQTFSGDIKVTDGTLAIHAPVAPEYADYKWFRLSIAQLGNGGSNFMQIRQICLFDKDGVRQNAGMTLAGLDCLTNETITIPAVDVGPGQAYYDKSVAGYQITGWSDSCGLAAVFDGHFSGTSGRVFMYWKTPSGSGYSPSPSNRSSWIPIVMHLSDSAHPITHFDVQGYAQTLSSLPTRLCLEASHDGEVWHEVWSNVDTSTDMLVPNVTGYNQWVSDSTVGNANNRPLGKGLTLSKSGEAVRQYFSWYRLWFAKFGDTKNTLSIRQIGLYDREGNRVNSGLTMAEPAGAPGETRTILGTVPQAGEVGYGASLAGQKLTLGTLDAGAIGACFADQYNGDYGKCVITWKNADGTSLTPDHQKRSTWIPIVMHLKAAADVHHFDVQLYEKDTLGHAPVRMLLEGSTDGVNWFVVYDNATTGSAFSTVPTGYNSWISDVKSASNTNHARPEGTGMDISAPYIVDPAATQFPDGVRVQVMSNGVLAADAPFEVKGLTVDAATAGTIDGFAFAADGTLDIANFTGDCELPGTYVNCEGLANVANWTTVTFDGDVKANRTVVVENGKLKVLIRGTTIILR